MKLQKNATMTR